MACYEPYLVHWTFHTSLENHCLDHLHDWCPLLLGGVPCWMLWMGRSFDWTWNRLLLSRHLDRAVACSSNVSFSVTCPTNSVFKTTFTSPVIGAYLWQEVRHCGYGMIGIDNSHFNTHQSSSTACIEQKFDGRVTRLYSSQNTAIDRLHAII